MRRKLLDKLLEWKKRKDRKPMVLEGARQVGKTYLLLHDFGEVYYERVVYVNFMDSRSRQVKEVFSRTMVPEEIILELERIYDLPKIDSETTLLFFDEIQDCPRALTALKFFCEEAPEYHVAVAGSLLGVYLSSSKEAPFPVGKVQRYRLEPMDFEEFLWASGKQRAVEDLKANPEIVSYRDTLLELLRQYEIVGGMPGAVAAWIETKDLRRVQEIQSMIISGYRDDFGKYTDNTTATRISQVFDTLPKQFAKASDKFFYGVVREGARAREYELAVEWLVGAGIVRRVRRVERGDLLPLKAYEDTSAFKLYFLDVGLFRCLAEIAPGEILEKNAMFDQFNGFFAKQFVLQQLAGWRMNYWAGSTSEVDFVTQDDGGYRVMRSGGGTEGGVLGIPGMSDDFSGMGRSRIIPIEVKSGENVKAKSLAVYRQKYNPELAVRFSLLPYEYNNGLLNIPLYQAFGFAEYIAKIV